MSSDSEDDCYGNIAQRLQSMKNKYSEDKIETTNLLLADLKEKTDNSWRKNFSKTSEKDCDLSQNDCDLSQNSETTEEYTLDAIIAKNSTKRATRAKRVADVCVDNILPGKTRKKRTKKGAQSASNSASDADVSRTDAIDTSTNSNNESVSETPPTRGRGGARGRARQTVDASTTSNDSASETASARGRGRARGRARQTTGRGRGRQTTLPESNSPSCSRGRSRRRGRRSFWGHNEYEPSMYDLVAAIAASAAMSNHGPIYSVGNTDEYPDQSDDTPLFTNSNPKPNDVVVVEENELDENEELSVKVYWQSSEHVKFNIRRFQKLTKIFDYFAERENVSKDKLFFTYNEKILRSDDTPDSINYSIVKFIDGGVINQSVSGIVKNDSKEEGIKLKFQCQNVKKPFVTYIQPDDTMMVAMMKCAEHFDQPIDKLKFHFDGDLITAKNTARELELEGGECIDVKVIS